MALSRTIDIGRALLVTSVGAERCGSPLAALAHRQRFAPWLYRPRSRRDRPRATDRGRATDRCWGPTRKALAALCVSGLAFVGGNGTPLAQTTQSISIFGDAVPNNPVEADFAAIYLGVKFWSSEPGTISMHPVLPAARAVRTVTSRSSMRLRNAAGLGRFAEGNRPGAGLAAG
jgi:hypothetical protein